MDQIVNLLNMAAPLVGMLLGTGLFVKYVPFMKNVSNQLIPLINAVLVFVTAFAAPAHAGIFGKIVGDLSLPARALGSVLAAAAASHVYEFYLRPILDKLGVKKAA